MSIIQEVVNTNQRPKVKRRYYRKRVDFFSLIQKVKLWPSRKRILHGIRSMTIMGNQSEITTHCNKRFIIRNSKNSRAARWLRNKWFSNACDECGVPEWKLTKYHGTFFKRGWGSNLSRHENIDKFRNEKGGGSWEKDRY